MSKIICDVCGTQYPESAEQCPICGCVRAAGGKTAADSIVTEEAQVESPSKERGGRFSKKNVRKRNKNAARYEVEPDRSRAKETESTEEEEMTLEAEPKSHRGLNALLIIIILALLAAIAYVFMNYLLPKIVDVPETTVSVTEAAETEEPTEEITEEPTIPCTSLELVNGNNQVIMTQAGQAWLLNVQAYPEDTTDVLEFISSNEAVVTVDGQGCVIAVGEGETIITAVCGEYSIEFDVICLFIDETEPADETVAETGEATDPGVEETVDPSATEGTETAEGTEAPADGTEATEGEPVDATEETVVLKDVVLSVTKDDLTFKMYGQEYIVRLSCDLTNQEVTWISENESIVKVDEDGMITCVGWGTTYVVAKYGDQEVRIICRCHK